MIQLLKAFATINTGTYNVAVLERFSRELVPLLREIGGEMGEVALRPQSVINDRGEAEPRELGKAFWVRSTGLGERGERAGPRILLAIHMDTVFAADSAFQGVTCVSEDIWRGPGVCDAKGGLLVLLFALLALERSEFARGVSWELLLNPDEEIGSPGSAGLFAEAAGRNDVGLLFEPALSDGSLVSSRKGSGTFTIVVRGRAAHAGRDSALGRNAIHALASLVSRLAESAGDYPGIVINTGWIHGGGAVNIVPELAVCRVNVRVEDGAQQRAFSRSIFAAIRWPRWSARGWRCRGRFRRELPYDSGGVQLRRDRGTDAQLCETGPGKSGVAGKSAAGVASPASGAGGAREDEAARGLRRRAGGAAAAGASGRGSAAAAGVFRERCGSDWARRACGAGASGGVLQRHEHVGGECGHGVAQRRQRTFFARQNPQAVDAGVFHNDVIAVAHREVLVYHERAFVDGARVVADLREALGRVCATELNAVCIPDSLLPLADAVRSYLFNSQIVSVAGGGMVLLAPAESGEIRSAASAIEFIRARVDAIGGVRYVDVRQSMRNGGGPACLRLRVELTDEEQSAVHPGIVFSEGLYAELRKWVQRNYRDELYPRDLADPRLLEESRRALDELTRLLKLPCIYPFQLP